MTSFNAKRTRRPTWAHAIVSSVRLLRLASLVLAKVRRTPAFVATDLKQKKGVHSKPSRNEILNWANPVSFKGSLVSKARAYQLHQPRWTQEFSSELLFYRFSVPTHIGKERFTWKCQVAINCIQRKGKGGKKDRQITLKVDQKTQIDAQVKLRRKIVPLDKLQRLQFKLHFTRKRGIGGVKLINCARVRLKCCVQPERLWPAMSCWHEKTMQVTWDQSTAACKCFSLE